jgi:aromatic ring hydroxylase
METLLPYTGREFFDSLDDEREVWIYGERVRNIAEHPAFRNTARMLARLYDALHRDHADQKYLLTCPTEWGGFTHRYFAAPRSPEELVAARDAIAVWSRLSYGWLGRSPDYKAAFLATLGATPCWQLSLGGNANAGKASTTNAWRSTTSMAGQCRTSSAQMTSVCFSRPRQMNPELQLLADAPIGCTRRVMSQEPSSWAEIMVALQEWPDKVPDFATAPVG